MMTLPVWPPLPCFPEDPAPPRLRELRRMLRLALNAGAFDAASSFADDILFLVGYRAP